MKLLRHCRTAPGVMTDGEFQSSRSRISTNNSVCTCMSFHLYVRVGASEKSNRLKKVSRHDGGGVARRDPELSTTATRDRLARVQFPRTPRRSRGQL